MSLEPHALADQADWLRREVVRIPQEAIEQATEILIEHLAKYGGGKGLELVGGKKWWQVRGRPLEGEWIEVSVLCVCRVGLEPQRLRNKAPVG